MINKGEMPSPASVREQVSRIVRSKGFASSERLVRFLVWTVDHALTDKADLLKQYAIGRDVFDRGEDFDPRIDSIVRTEAQRLRRKLGEYYSDEGAADPILISFPRGSYAPLIQSLAPERSAESVRPNPPVASLAAVAVPAFANLTANPDQDYFCRGIAESIQARLASSPHLKVIASPSSLRFTGTEDPARVGQELNVNTVVQGSVQRFGHKIRIHARLVELPSNAYIWSRVFDRSAKDAFAIQDEIAQAVGEALTVHLLGDEGGSHARPPSAEAYNLYLRGRNHWNELTVRGAEQSVECFVRAIALFPNYPQPYAALAETYLWLIFLGARESSHLIGVTRRLILQALRLDRKCAEAFSALGSLSGAIDWKWQDAEVFFERGLVLRPGYVPGYLQRAVIRLQRADFAGAGEDADKILDLDPLSVRSYRLAGVRSYLMRDYEDALVAYNRAIGLNPHVQHTYFLKGLALLQVRRFDQAIAALQQSISGFEATPYLGTLAAAYSLSGQPVEAKNVLDRLADLATHSFVSPAAFVIAHLGAGHIDKALDWLEVAADRRHSGLMFLRTDPLLDPLRTEPRFKRVLARMDLDQPLVAAQSA